MTHEQIATSIKDLNDKSIVLIYAFNATGKTRLCVEYKNVTKKDNGGQHAGVYYNAYSEDLFQWDNEGKNNHGSINLGIVNSSLSTFHGILEEGDSIRKKLEPYQPKYKFELTPDKDPERGIAFVTFYESDEKRT